MPANMKLASDERAVDSSKGVGEFAAGVVKTVVSVSAVKSTLKLWWQKLVGRHIEVTLQVGKKKIVAKVNNEKELRSVFKLADKFASGS
jgi:peptidyl-tRNA hydrolase